MVKEDTEDVSVPKAIQPPKVVCQIDVAEAVGLMTQKTSTCDVYPFPGAPVTSARPSEPPRCALPSSLTDQV